MRAATVLVGLLLLGGSAFAADAQVRIVVAAADVKQSPAMRVQPAPVQPVSVRLDRDSGYGLFLAP